MLEYMRNASQGFIGKAIMTVLMGLIIVSFGIWGIADVFHTSASNQVASVGGQVITTDQYALAYRQQVNQYSRMLKTALTAQQARSLGLDQAVLQRLEDDAALDARVKQLGLALSDDQVAAMVRADPNFLDQSGAFNRTTFDQLLQQNNLTEASFFAQQRAFYARREIESALTNDAAAPKALIETLAKIDGQTRGIDYFTLPAASVGDIPAPSDADLQKFFDAHKASYRAPEYRALTIVEALPDAMAKPGEVADDEVKALYEKDKAKRFTDPAKRHVEQIVFPSDAEATAALAKIKGGESFDDLAKERNLKPADTDLGIVTQDALFDKPVADAAFALPEGGVSDVVKSQFGPVLLRASQISPGGVKSLDDVSTLLKDEIAQRRAQDDILKLHDKIEDARTSGKSVADAAKDAGLTTKTVDAVDATGKDKSGAPVAIAQAPDVVKAAFASDVGGDDPPVQTKGGGLVWFDVTKIEPARDRPLDEVKDKVLADYHADAVAKALTDKAADLVKQLKGGADLTKMAADLSTEKKSAAGIKRSGAEGLSQGLVNAVFETGPNGAGSAADAQSRIVFKVSADTLPTIDLASPEIVAAGKKLGQGIGADVLSQYVGALKKDLGVTVDQDAIGRAVTQ